MCFARLKRLARTVSFRIALWHSVTFIAGAVLVFTAAFLLLRHSIDEQVRDSIEFRLNQFTWEYERAGQEGVIKLCNLRKGRTQKAFFVRVADGQNQTIFLRDPEDWAEFHPQTLAAQPVPEGASWLNLSGLDGSVLRVVNEKMSDGVLLQVGKTWDGSQDLLDRFRSALTAIAGVIIIAGVLGGASVAYRALRPVRQLTESVRSILGTGKFDIRVPLRGTGDEIDELVQCFNLMIAKIELLLRGMRDSLDNVAHDLRTPLTRLRNIATKALEQDYDKDASHEVLIESLEETERVMTMLVTLMDVAEAEAGVMKLDSHPVDLHRLAGRILDLYQHVADEKQIEISVDVPPGLQITGDTGRLLRALANLMDNALKYTPERGRVRIGASANEAGVVIEFTDTGEGISNDELTRIWERLYRVDKSRSQRGLGLGLSFVKAIVEAHGGKVSVRSECGVGSCFSVQFPG